MSAVLVAVAQQRFVLPSNRATRIVNPVAAQTVPPQTGEKFLTGIKAARKRAAPGCCSALPLVPSLGDRPVVGAVGTEPVHGPCERQTTLTVCADLINTDDHPGNMAAVGALVAPKPSYGGNVVPMRIGPDCRWSRADGAMRVGADRSTPHHERSEQPDTTHPAETQR
jgi:hypothetical protein